MYKAVLITSDKRLHAWNMVRLVCESRTWRISPEVSLNELSHLYTRKTYGESLNVTAASVQVATASWVVFQLCWKHNEHGRYLFHLVITCNWSCINLSIGAMHMTKILRMRFNSNYIL